MIIRNHRENESVASVKPTSRNSLRLLFQSSNCLDQQRLISFQVLRLSMHGTQISKRTSNSSLTMSTQRGLKCKSIILQKS